MSEVVIAWAPRRRRLLRTLLASPRCAGFQLTIYAPDLDPEARCAQVLADLIEHALAA